MCISKICRKYRTEKCRNNETLVINATSIKNSTYNIFCTKEDDFHPWFTPEVDIYDKNHLTFYDDNDTEVDVSENDFPNDLWIVKSPVEIIIKTSIFVPLVVWGIFANVCLLYVILKHRHLRSPTNMVIANMAIVDLISLVIYPWLFLISDFFQNYKFGEFGCRVDGWWEFSLLLVNVMNLSTISYDRLTAIVLPKETRLTRKGAKIIIACTWIVSLLLASPLIIFRQFKIRQWKNFTEIFCTENTTFVAMYWHILLVMAVWLPLAIMVICYSAIFIKLDRYERKVLKREHPLSVCYKTRVAKIVFAVLITFIICRIPLTALIFRRNQWLKVNNTNQVLGANQILWFISRYLIYANAALDPLLYGLTNENFRRVFRKTPLTKIFFPKKKKPPVIEKMCVNVIQPRGPYKSDNKSDKSLILKNNNNSMELSKEKTNVTSQKTDKMMFT